MPKLVPVLSDKRRHQATDNYLNFNIDNEEFDPINIDNEMRQTSRDKKNNNNIGSSRTPLRNKGTLSPSVVNLANPKLIHIMESIITESDEEHHRENSSL